MELESVLNLGGQSRTALTAFAYRLDRLQGAETKKEVFLDGESHTSRSCNSPTMSNHTLLSLYSTGDASLRRWPIELRQITSKDLDSFLNSPRPSIPSTSTKAKKQHASQFIPFYRFDPLLHIALSRFESRKTILTPCLT